MNPTITKFLDEVRERTEKATEGPWHKIETKSNGTVIGKGNVNAVPEGVEYVAIATGFGERIQVNSDFIAHSRTDIPTLLAIAEEALRALEEIPLAKGYNILPICIDTIARIQTIVENAMKEGKS